ncbi:MAG: transketolase C-terminal domain-containing protein, partial [Ilumatobacteraceae bacterium]
QAALALDATVVDMRFVKPLDTALVTELAARHSLLVTIEEHQIMGGAGSAVAEALTGAGVAVPLLHLGLPDRFIDHGDPVRLLAQLGLDAEGKEALIDLFDEASTAGAALVVATHELGFVSKTKRTIALRDGQLIFDGLSTEAEARGLVSVEGAAETDS